MFDPDNPPDTFKKFRRAIKRTIENAEIKSDDEYDTALFIVDREGNADIVYANTIWEEYKDQVDPEMILSIVMPSIVKSYESKFFALVLPSLHKTEETSFESVIVITSDALHMEVVEAEVDREEEYIELEPWEKQDVQNYIEILQPFRQAITLQG